mmetsp:Transcript_84079/g.116147  ORF Transcript_84079/g.116147 Transcript_84079/m.116147 type:complete len:212 (-) Transcript_84079:19-654(-)
MVARSFHQLLLLDQTDNSQVIKTEKGILTQNSGVLVQQFLHLVELHVSINQEFLSIEGVVVFFEKRVNASLSQFLVNSPSDFSDQFSNLVVEFDLLLRSFGIKTTLSTATLVIDPDCFESFFFIEFILPELILLLKKIIVKNVSRFINSKELFIGSIAIFLRRAEISSLSSTRVWGLEGRIVCVILVISHEIINSVILFVSILFKLENLLA